MAGAGDDLICDAILRLAAARGADKTICPSEVARHLGGPDEALWRPLMAPIRAQAIRLARDGRVDLRKGGATVAPDDLSGIYRIAYRDR